MTQLKQEEAKETVVSSGTKKAIPEATVPGGDNKSSDSDSETKDGHKSEPSEPPEIKRPAIPATFRGWREVSGWKESDRLTGEDELDDLLLTPTILESYLPDPAYGDWYHNVGVLLVAGLFSWILGHFRFSLGPVFFVTLITAVYYRTQIRRYRSVIKENTQREMLVKKIETDYETMDWLNALLDKYWIFLEPYICQTVAETVNPMIPGLITSLPAFIQAVWIDTLTLGSKPFRIESVKTLPETLDDVLVMDWCVSFTPNDHHDLTFKQLKNRVNQKAVVKIKVFGFSIPIVVKNVAFRSTVRVRIHMMESFPHIDVVNVLLPELPMIDFVTKILGDSVFNWEVLAIPGLWPFMYEMVKKYAGPMILPPFSFQLNVEQLVSGDLSGISGILAVTMHSADKIKLFDRTLDNTVDPYVTLGFGNEVAAKTTTLEDTKRAEWNETLYILVSNLQEPLRMVIYDYNPDRKDGQIGILDYDLQSLKVDPVQNRVTNRFLRNNKPVGNVCFSLEYMPVILPKRLIDGSVEPPPELNTGVTRIELITADFESKLTALVDVFVNGRKVIETGVYKKTEKPSYGKAASLAVTNLALALVLLVLKDNKGKEFDLVYTSLNDLIGRTVIGRTNISLAHGLGLIKASASWSPVKMENVSGSLTYTEPIGVVKVVVNNARDLRNLETVGKIDPYVRVLLNGFAKGRTTMKESTTNPDWNEALWVPVSLVNQKLTLEAMDTETGKDRLLGSFDLRLLDIILRDEQGNLVEYSDKEPRSNRLVARKFLKGTITYSLSFYPLEQVLSVDEEERILKASEKAKAEAEKAAKLSAAEKKKAEREAQAQKELESYDQTAPLASAVTSFDKLAKKRASLEELCEKQAGVFAFQILGGDFKVKNAYLQLFFDAGGYAEYVSPKLSTEKDLRGVGDVVVKELDWSECVVRLAENKDDNRAEDPIAEASIQTINLLKNGYKEPLAVQLNDGLVVNIKSRFIPLIGDMPVEDTIAGLGTMTVEIKEARDLISADLNGKSDPFVKLFLNGSKKEVYKTKTKKKTLDPVWNESCSFDVANRFYAFLRVSAMDWDFGSGQDDPLGHFDFPLSEVKSDGTPTEVEVRLQGDNGVANGGVVYLVFRFKPHYIVPVSKFDRSLDTAVFDTGKTFISGGGKIIGGTIGGGVSAVGKVKNTIFGKKKD